MVPGRAAQAERFQKIDAQSVKKSRPQDQERARRVNKDTVQARAIEDVVWGTG
jgi:hypothetical protein